AFLFARDSANIVRFQITPGDEFTPGKLTLTATSAELGDNVNELGAIVEGEGGEIAFNARYLIDVLSVIDEPQVALEISDPRRPGVIRPVGVGPEEFTHVVMPMHLAR
ncbi:MAG TPA: DNA polymerase III subunit beta, partial [Anaerolineae bacterium]|nr:DNA polymerase III subunit beta [Anaerolineae bacterium]